MSAFLTSLGVALKELFHPDTPGPIRNEIQREFGLAMAAILRNRRLRDGVNERADENDQRRRLKDRRMTMEERVELAAVSKRMEDGIKLSESTEAARQADAEKRRAAKRKTVKHKAELAQLDASESDERIEEIKMQAARVDKLLSRLEAKGLSLEWDENSNEPHAS